MMRRLAVALAVVALVLPLGYLSNWLTRRACERNAARHVGAGIGAVGVPIFVLPASARGSADALRAAGLAVQPCQSSGAGFNCWPWGEVKSARTIAPYVMAVEWGFVKAPLSGLGTENRYLCLFGLAVQISHRELWIT